MSFVKNIAKYLAINPKQSEELFKEIKESLISSLDKGESVDNKIIVAIFRKLSSKYNQKISQTAAYEILSKLMGNKNYNIALAKGIDFKELFFKENRLDKIFVDPPYEKGEMSLNDYWNTPNLGEAILPQIPTGITDLDEDLLGGLPSGELSIVLGATNTGKSLFCISLGCNALKQEKKVLHIALEGDRNEALNRYASNLSGISYSKIVKQSFTVDEDNTMKNMTSKYDNSLRIRKMVSTGGFSIEEVVSYCENMYLEFNFDMVVIDYGQLLKTKDESLTYRQTMAKVFRGLDYLSKKCKCVVVTPVQINRGSVKKEIIRSSDVSETFEIARVSGVILSINATEEEMRHSKLRIFLEKQRIGAKNKIYGIIPDYSKCNLITGNNYDPFFK